MLGLVSVSERRDIVSKECEKLKIILQATYLIILSIPEHASFESPKRQFLHLNSLKRPMDTWIDRSWLPLFQKLDYIIKSSSRSSLTYSYLSFFFFLSHSRIATLWLSLSATTIADSGVLVYASPQGLSNNPKNRKQKHALRFTSFCAWRHRLAWSHSRWVDVDYFPSCCEDFYLMVASVPDSEKSTWKSTNTPSAIHLVVAATVATDDIRFVLRLSSEELW